MVLFPKRGKRLDTDSPPYRIIILTVVVTTSTWDYLTFRPSSFWFPAVSLDKVLSPLSPDPTWQIVRRGGVFSYTGAFRTGIDGRAPLARPSHRVGAFLRQRSHSPQTHGQGCECAFAAVLGPTLLARCAAYQVASLAQAGVGRLGRRSPAEERRCGGCW